MPRGFVWGDYVDDLGIIWTLRVDADHFLSPQRGWVASQPGTYPLPREWRPRFVIGVDPLGGRRRAVVATTSSGLWTGAATTFDIEASDNTIVTCTVVESRGEKRQVAS